MTESGVEPAADDAMKPRLTLFVLLLVAAVGGGFSWWAVDSAEPICPDGAASSAAADEATETSPARREGGEIPAEGGRATDASRDETRVAVEGSSASPTAMVGIRGRLVDAEGTPLPGLGLRCRTWESIGQAVDFPLLGSGSGLISARSDVEGRFLFSMPEDRSGRLEVADGDYVFAVLPDVIRGGAGDRDLGDLAMLRGARIRGVVRGKDGERVGGVRVSLAHDELDFGSRDQTMTEADGEFEFERLRPGDWVLRTASAHHLPAVAKLTLKVGEERSGVVLVVEPGQAISGLVVDDLGRPVAGIKVGAKRVQASGGIDVERFSGAEAVTTGVGGRFTLSGLEGAAATVRAYGKGYATAVVVDVPVGKGDLVLRVPRCARIEGTLMAADGSPLAGSRVRVSSTAGGGSVGFGVGRVRSAVTAADGSFGIEEVRPGIVNLVAEGESHLPATREGIEIQPGQTKTGVRMVASRGAVARVRVLDEAGQAVSGAEVTASRPRKPHEPGEIAPPPGLGVGGESLGKGVSGEDGMAILEGLAGGEARFSATADGYADAMPVLVTLARDGNIDLLLTLRTPGYVDLAVVGADGESVEGARYRVRPIDAEEGASTTGVCDQKGRALVGPLAPGRYVAELIRDIQGIRLGGAHVIVSGDEGGAIRGTEQQFVVTAGATTEVVIRRPLLARVSGSVLGAEGPVAGCVVEIVEDDGADLPMVGIGGGRSVTTGADGAFAIEDVAAGEHVLRYGRPEQIVKAEFALSVPPDTRDVLVELPLRTGNVRVRAWDIETHAPIAGAEVELRRVRPGGGEAKGVKMVMVSVAVSDGAGEESSVLTLGARSVKTGADGWAEIESVPPGDYVVEVRHKAFAPVDRGDITVEELQTTDIGRVEMSPAGGIRGTVVAADGSPASMALVSSRPVGAGTADEELTPAMGGSFGVDALPPGRYVLRAQAVPLGNRDAGAFGPEVEVDVIAGRKSRVELRLPPP